MEEKELNELTNEELKKKYKTELSIYDFFAKHDSGDGDKECYWEWHVKPIEEEMIKRGLIK